MIIKMAKIILCTTLFLFSLIKPGLGGVVIDLQDNAAVAGKIIQLKDIATVKGGDVAELKKLEEIYIGQAPLPGKKRIIGQSYVNTRLLQAGRQGDSFQLKGAKEIQVQAISQLLDPNRVTELAENYIMDNLSDSQQRIEIELIQAPEKIALPPGGLELQVDPAFSLPDSCRQVYVPVKVFIAGEPYRILRASFRIRRFGQVVVSAQDIKRQQILTPSDLEVVEKEVTSLRETPFSQVESLIGKCAANFIRKGTVLTTNLAEIPLLIKRGDVVTIKKEVGPLLITALGRAQNDGRLGQRIRAQNLDSKTILVGKVQDEHTIIVE